MVRDRSLLWVAVVVVVVWGEPPIKDAARFLLYFVVCWIPRLLLRRCGQQEKVRKAEVGPRTKAGEGTKEQAVEAARRELLLLLLLLFGALRMIVALLLLLRQRLGFLRPQKEIQRTTLQYAANHDRTLLGWRIAPQSIVDPRPTPEEFGVVEQRVRDSLNENG